MLPVYAYYMSSAFFFLFFSFMCVNFERLVKISCVCFFDNHRTLILSHIQSQHTHICIWTSFPFLTSILMFRWLWSISRHDAAGERQSVEALQRTPGCSATDSPTSSLTTGGPLFSNRMSKKMYARQENVGGHPPEMMPGFAGIFVATRFTNWWWKINFTVFIFARYGSGSATFVLCCCIIKDATALWNLTSMTRWSQQQMPQLSGTHRRRFAVTPHGHSWDHEVL